MSDALKHMQTEEAKRIALQLYDQIKEDFDFDNPELSDKIQNDLYEVLKEYSVNENLTGIETCKIVKQFFLNVLAMVANLDLEDSLKKQKDFAQKELR